MQVNECNFGGSFLILNFKIEFFDETLKLILLLKIENNNATKKILCNKINQLKKIYIVPNKIWCHQGTHFVLNSFSVTNNFYLFIIVKHKKGKVSILLRENSTITQFFELIQQVYIVQYMHQRAKYIWAWSFAAEISVWWQQNDI